MSIGLEKLPADVWNAYLTPCLSRYDWNAVRVASKPFYLLTESTSIAPPWPQQCYGVQGGHTITTFSISHDGEYMAVGSMLGSIEIWSRKHGKIRMVRNKESLSSSSSSSIREATTSSIIRNRTPASSQLRRSRQPLGSVVKFAPIGHLLASAHENRIFLQCVSDTKASNNNSNLDFQTLQIAHSTSYEVTYLGFSHDATLLMARYGKMAYIWKATNASTTNCVDIIPTDYTPIYQLPLPSSRCQMASSLCMKFFAVTSANCSEDKGTIEVWNLQDAERTKDPTSRRCCSNKISAHSKQIIRGLEFVSCEDRSGAIDANNHFLISATLQGQVKCWKYKEGEEVDSESRAAYACIRTFQVTGKIFSLTVLVPSFGTMPLALNGTNGSIYFATGQARGQVQAWKVSLDMDMQEIKNDDSIGEDHKASDTTCEDGSVVDSPATNINTQSARTPSVSSNDALQKFLSVEVGEHMHHDNIKLLSFTPDGRNVVASRAYDARIWFHSFR